MTTNEIGEILYSLPNNLNWKIPRLSDLPQQSDSQIRSPKFGYHAAPMKFDDVAPGWHFYYTPNSGKKPVEKNKIANSKWIKLSITFELEDIRPIYWIRVGVVDETGKIINIRDCTWNYTYGVFSEINLVQEGKLKLRQCGAVPNGYLQLFCEIPSKVCTPYFGVETETGSRNARNSLADSSLASTSVSSRTDDWYCTVCLFKNRTDDIICMACQTPKAKSMARQTPKTKRVTCQAPKTKRMACQTPKTKRVACQPPKATNVACEIPKAKRMKNATTTSTTNSNSTSTCNNSGIEDWICQKCQKNNFASESLCIACQTPKPREEKNITGLDILSQNLKDVFTEKKHTDLTITVQGREFNVHKLILTARSSVFEDMLSNQQQNNKTKGRKKKKTATKQQKNNENIIDIQDCDPGVFEEFLLFVYSGKIKNMTCDNAYSLYYAADKYNLFDLKCECIDFLKKNVSLENVCEIIRLATKHNETELLNLATNYFALNMDEILTTSQWMLFLQDDHVAANKLCMQGLQLGFTKKGLMN